MTPQQTAVAETCLIGSYEDTLSFPECVGKLIEAGFEAYLVDYRRNTRTHYLPDGDCLVLNNPHTAGPIGASFDGAGVAAAIKWAQQNPPDYTYAMFNDKVTDLGCAGYLVSFLGRRVVYYGRTGDVHTEYFPN